MSETGPDAAPTTSGGDQSTAAPTMRAITISREYGSGGGEIAARLAKRLSWKLIDHEIVAQVAAELGISHEEAAQRDERAEGIIMRILMAMAASEPSVFVPVDPLRPLDTDAYRDALYRVVTVSVASGNAVIVGRGSQVILKDSRDVLHARFVAPLDKRIVYVAQREGLDIPAAQRRIQEKDHSRQQFVQSLYSARPDDARLYDLVLNTGILSLDDCVELVCQALDRKAERLGLPDDALGPGAGIARYAGKPEDLPALQPPTHA
ncbi:MAG TPA: cytidylate kinase-like family protein [Ktedonobacterales bacterium]|nr:cytidylate kinase-like family protein [Ktedonobacterales bacterium]